MSDGIGLKRRCVRLLLVLMISTSVSLAVAQEAAPVKPSAPPAASPAQKPTPETPGKLIRPPTLPDGPQIGPPPLPAKVPGNIKKSPRWFELQPMERRLGSASLTGSRGMRVLVDNRTPGRITLRGWDRDVIEARSTSERGDEVVMFTQNNDGNDQRIYLKADYANRDNAQAPTQALDLPPLGKDGPILVNLTINLPRYAEIEGIIVNRSDVEIVGMPTPVSILSKSSNVTVRDAGSVEAHTRTGAIVIENANGIVELSSSTGTIKVANSQGAVHAVSIAGSIEVSCMKGRIDVENTQAPIELSAIDGDVEAIAATSNVRYTGALNREGRYYLKSMSGLVEMIIPANTSGFNATLTSYRGTVSSDFPLKPRSQVVDAVSASHRLTGRFGNGSTPQVTLDSFEGFVKLSKLTSAPPTCQ
jgi:hypothetical protein